MNEIADKIKHEVGQHRSSLIHFGWSRGFAKYWIDQVGDPTIIINNAGVVKGKLLLDLTEQDINE